MHQFNEHHPELKGFSDFFHAEIFPILQRDETARLEVIKDIKKAQVALGVVGVVVALGAFYFGASVAVFLFIAGLLFMSMMGTSSYFMNDVKTATKNNIVGGVCRFLGWDFIEKTEHAPYFDRFVELGLLSKSYTRERFEDLVSGEAHGARFEFYEAHLEQKKTSGKSSTWVTVFRGQLLALEFDRKFLGKTVVLRDKGWAQGKKKGDMKRVGLVDPVFEKIFEAYGTDQVEARYLLTPTFMQRLVDLENSVNGSNIRFGFIGGQLLIAVETANRYESGSMSKPLIDTERTQNILDEVGAIYDVIDGVMKR